MHGGDSGRMFLAGRCADKDGCSIIIDVGDGSVIGKYWRRILQRFLLLTLHAYLAVTLLAQSGGG